MLHFLKVSEKEITTRDGRWLAVKFIPYRTQDNVIDGILIIFTNINDYKKRYMDVRETLAKTAGNGL